MFEEYGHAQTMFAMAVLELRDDGLELRYGGLAYSRWLRDDGLGTLRLRSWNFAMTVWALRDGGLGISR